MDKSVLGIWAVTILLVGMLSGIATPGISEARADQGEFSLSSGFVSPSEYGTTKTADLLSTPTVGKYQTGPWAFKLTVPNSGNPGIGVTVPEIGLLPPSGNAANSLQSGFTNSEAAATYNIYSGNIYSGNVNSGNINSGGISSFGVNLTGKVTLGMPDKSFSLGSVLNDYAAQADAYQSFDKFRALGSLGYKIHGDPAGINMNRVVYGSVGGAYQLNDQLSGGVDFRLSQNPSALEPGQRQLSAYLSHNVGKSVKARGYLLEDFSNGNPDRSVGAAVSYGF
ncbi:MAG: hypothetical protein WBQ69_05575 [Gallionella sp.]